MSKTFQNSIKMIINFSIIYWWQNVDVFFALKRFFCQRFWTKTREKFYVFLVSLLFMSGVSACSGYAALDNKFEIACPKVTQFPYISHTPIVYWSMWDQGEPQMKILDKAAQCFQTQTGIPIEIQWLGRKLLTTNVVPALNLGDDPDLFDQDVSQIRAAVADKGVRFRFPM